MLYTVYRTLVRGFLSLFLLPNLVVLLLLSSCGSSGRSSGFSSSSDPDPTDLKAWESRYPSSHFITAWGFSSENPRQAGRDAKAAVAAAVRSSVESELISIMESEAVQGEVTDYQKLKSNIRITAHFDHAELIKLVSQTAHRDQGEYKVLAVLSREEAAQELLIPYETQAVDFRLLAARLDSLENDFPRFTIIWKKLKSQHEKMLAPAAEVRAVSGRQLRKIARDESLWTNASAARMKVLNEALLVVELGRHPDLDHDELSGKIQSALASLGLSTTAGPCNPEALRLKLNPTVTWKRVVGRVVQLEFAGDLGSCGSESPWTTFVISDRHLRGEGRRPVEDLMARMEPEILAQHFSELLADYLPF